MRYRKRLAGIFAAQVLMTSTVQAGFGAYGPGMDAMQAESGNVQGTKKTESAKTGGKAAAGENGTEMAGETGKTVTGPAGGTKESTAKAAGETENAAAGPAGGAGDGAVQTAGTFDVERFVLPDQARVLVVVEGTGKSSCTVYAYEYETAEDGAGRWAFRLSTAGYLGKNGMSSHRTSGDKTTPIGLFQMRTPFGQAAPLPGFPENYIQVKESHVWSDRNNILVEDASEYGERVGTSGYSEYYDYVIDAGFNRNAIEKKGSALFLHCFGHGRTETSGCVAIDKEQMAEIMKLYGKYGDGCCYIAQAPQGTFEFIYDSYGANQGLSPDGDFGD